MDEELVKRLEGVRDMAGLALWVAKHVMPDCKELDGVEFGRTVIGSDYITFVIHVSELSRLRDARWALGGRVEPDKYCYAHGTSFGPCWSYKVKLPGHNEVGLLILAKPHSEPITTVEDAG